MANDFGLVKKAFKEKFGKKIGSQDIIREATDGVIDEIELTHSVD